MRSQPFLISVNSFKFWEDGVQNIQARRTQFKRPENFREDFFCGPQNIETIQNHESKLECEKFRVVS